MSLEEEEQEHHHFEEDEHRLILIGIKKIGRKKLYYDFVWLFVYKIQ